MCAFSPDHTDFKSLFNKKRNQLLTSFYDLPFHRLVRGGEITWTSDEDFVNEAVLKAYKRAVYTQKGYYENPWETQYLPHVSNRIKETDLYKFLERMPKGAILHLHPSSMGEYGDLLNTAAEQTWNGKTYWVDLDEEKIIFQESSPGGAYVSLREALADPDKSHRIVSWFRITGEELHQDTDTGPWVYFRDKFNKVGMLLDYNNPELCYHYYYNAFRHLLTIDNIMHVELRTSWKVENEKHEGSKESVILKALAAVNRDCGGNSGLTLKIIWSDSRTFARKERKTILEDIIYVGHQVKSPDNVYLIGYDLVSEGRGGETFYYLLDDISSAYSQLGGFLPPFFWHDGESELPPDYEPHHQNGNKFPRNVYFSNNLIDAYLMSNPPFQNRVGRVGHGIELFKTPKLLEEYCELELPVELCPVSSQFLKYIKNLREHPGQSYLASGLPVSLSPDDPAIYSYQGVTIDFWEACMAWNLDLKMLKTLSYYSLKCSGLSSVEKKETIVTWRHLWDDFIKRQIAETIP